MSASSLQVKSLRRGVLCRSCGTPSGEPVGGAVDGREGSDGPQDGRPRSPGFPTPETRTTAGGWVPNPDLHRPYDYCES